MYEFKASLELIGINPFVFVPETILTKIFQQAGKSKGYIPICGTVNDLAFKQTLVKFKGEWRFYINTSMLKNSPKRIGEILDIKIQFDSSDRTLKLNEKLSEALSKNKTALKVFQSLSPSKQNEMNRYITNLKSEEIIQKNIKKAIGFLLGKNSFVGREKP